MKIGYPCINHSIECKGGKTFRLKSYSGERLAETVENNLNCLSKMLYYNREHGLHFFRISSQLVPFASHAVCTFDWKKHFKDKFKTIGRFIRENGMRISMHPDQFILLNSPAAAVTERSIKELEYHADVLELLGLGRDAKIQIHGGGIYGDKKSAMARFVKRYECLSPKVLKHLVVENDEWNFSVNDCLELHRETGIAVLFDYFHNEISDEPVPPGKAAARIAKTWTREDGIMMVDYSSQGEGRRGTHAASIDENHFKKFLGDMKGISFDIMLEIKDKEKSALKALVLAQGKIRKADSPPPE